MAKPASLLLILFYYSTFSQKIVFHDVNVINGKGEAVQFHQNVTISGQRIVAIRPVNSNIPADATVIHVEGKTIMPLMINTHGHLGLLKDTTMSSANYTPDNIRRHLKRFLDYGVGAVLCMGTDHTEIFAMRQQSQAGKMPGATIYTAGIGFGVKGGAPPLSYGMDQVYRPESADQARKDVIEIAASHPDVIKIWVDDFFGKMPKMKPEIYRAIIAEAHKQGIRVAAHLFYLDDAHSLVAAGLDIMAHSIRDKEIDSVLLKEMKDKHVVYIPTLALDEFAFSYEDDPGWLKDSFFIKSLEPNVYGIITSPAYKAKLKNNPATAREQAALQIALTNIKRVYDAGIMISLGTDAGAQPIRPMGFSEHMELELLVRAGIPPLQAIQIATQNGATLLKIDKDNGSIELGKKADFIILNANPADDIANTQKIYEVWKDGKKVR